MKNIRTFICILAGLFFMLSKPANAQESIKIALLSGFSGVASIPSYHLLHTAMMETDELNAHGGIHGKPIELVILDDESNPIKTVELTRDPRLQDAVGVIGFPWSQFILAAGAELQKLKIPSISILATHDHAMEIGDYLFRVCFSNNYQGKKLAEYAFKKVRVRNAILFVDYQNSYSVDLAKTIKKEFTKRGGKIVHEIGYIPQKGTDYFFNELKNIDKRTYDSVFIPDDQVYVMPIMDAFIKIGATDKIYFGGDGWNMANIQIKNTQLDNFQIHVVGHWNNDNPNQQNKMFIKKFQSLYRTEPQDASALSHDALYILVEAIKKVPSLDKILIKQRLLQTNYNGLTGKIQFAKDGDPIHKPIVIHKVYKGKRESIVYQ